MTNREFMQWAVWNSVSPIGDERCHDLGPALERMTTAQIHSPKGTQFELQDFLPFSLKPKFNDIEAGFMRWAKQMGASGR